MDSIEIKEKLSEFCLIARAEIPNKDQKVQAPLNYCVAILEECLEILELVGVEESESSEAFLEKFTAYWESKMKEMLNAL